MSISVVVLTKNEESHIAQCLQSVQWAKEILVIDDNSLDKTREIAKQHGAKVFVHPLENNFANQRNFALSKVSSEWVLFVDADERVSEELAKEIQLKIKENKNGFFIKREDTMWHKKLQYGETGNIWLLRLGKKLAGRWHGAVHEIWDIEGPTDNLKNALIHYPHASVVAFLQKINFYSDIRAKELFEKGVKANWITILAYPKAKFFVNFFIKQGYRDGMPGIIVAITMSFHSFLVRGKLWQLWQKK